VAVPFDQPVLVAGFAEGGQSLAEFLHGLEGPDPEQVLLERSE
jgi:hypothetical protein